MKFPSLFFILLLAGYCLAEETAATTISPPTSAQTTSSSTPTTASTPASTTAVPTTTASTTAVPTTDVPTTSSPNITTLEPSSTTPAPAPTTSAPKQDDFFRVEEGNVTCIMFSADFEFHITYDVDGKSVTQNVKLPKPSDERLSETTGKCSNLMETEYIKIKWGPTNSYSNFQIDFNSTADKWSIIDFSAELQLSGDVFPNATDVGKVLQISGELPSLSDVPVDTNSSLVCRSNVESKKFTGEVANSTQTYTVTASAVGVKVQAYNFVPFTHNLQQGEKCANDFTSDMVPIAVGCALAGLVLLVLISYLIGRRRRKAAYQSLEHI